MPVATAYHAEDPDGIAFLPHTSTRRPAVDHVRVTIENARNTPSLV